MTFARARPAGFAVRSKLLSTEMETIDSQMPFALDTRGGTYTASTLIALGGAGVEISGSGLSVTSALTIGASGAVQFGAASTIAFLGTTTVSSGTLAFGVGTTLNISSPTVVFSGSTITLNTASIINISGGGGITVAASSVAVFSGLVTFNDGPITMAAVMNISGTGHTVKRVVTTADANASYGIRDGDIFVVPNLTAARTYTLSNTGATEGCVMEFTAFHNSGAFEATIQNAALSFLSTMREVSGIAVNLRVIFRSGGWELLSYLLFP